MVVLAEAHPAGSFCPQLIKDTFFAPERDHPKSFYINNEQCHRRKDQKKETRNRNDFDSNRKQCMPVHNRQPILIFFKLTACASSSLTTSFFLFATA